MKKILLLLLSVMFSQYIQGQNRLWDFYQQIQDYQSVQIGDWTIKPDYTISYLKKWHVHLENKEYGADGFASVPIVVSATGNVIWENEKLIADVDVNIECSCPSVNVIPVDAIRTVYISVVARNQTSPFHERYMFNLSDDKHTASIESNASIPSVDLNMTFESKHDGNFSRHDEYRIIASDSWSDRGMKGVFPVKYSLLSQSARNRQSEDQYGKWTWNNSKTEFYLTSLNNRDSLCIKLPNADKNVDNLIFTIKFNEEASGYDNLNIKKPESTDENLTLTHLMVSVDGSPEIKTSFLKNSNGEFIYCSYDRFLEDLSLDSSEFIEQIMSHNTLLISYDHASSNKTTNFKISGLKALFESYQEFIKHK